MLYWANAATASATASPPVRAAILKVFRTLGRMISPHDEDRDSSGAGQANVIAGGTAYMPIRPMSTHAVAILHSPNRPRSLYARSIAALCSPPRKFRFTLAQRRLYEDFQH